MARVIVVGAGAAGLTAAIAAASGRGVEVLALDGAPRIGAKILISGGGRCNVTNRVVTPGDFHGGSQAAVGRILRAFTVDETIAWFAGMGVGLHEEPLGKLFPDTGRARTVVDALLAAAAGAGVRVATGARVHRIERRGTAGFRVESSQGAFDADRVVLATGGLSVPQTGSDGAGYAFAQALGHSLVPTTPALVPLVLGVGFHASVSGVTHPAALRVSAGGRRGVEATGSLLWTHTGISGPVVLDASRHWHRAVLEGASPEVHVNLCPGDRFETVDAWLLAEAAARPRASIATIAGSRVPEAIAGRLVSGLELDPATRLAHLGRDERRRVAHALTAYPLDVTGSRGYAVAEVTAGGVPLAEVDPRTLESRRCPGLHLAGEILDVDGRIGGFNFQWAWATGHVAGRGVTAALDRESSRR